MTVNTYDIVIPTNEGDLEIPWTSVRALSDPAFEQHLAATAAGQARQIGLRIRELRLQQGLRLEELAARVDLRVADLERVECGQDGIVLPRLDCILAAMGHKLRDVAADGPDT